MTIGDRLRGCRERRKQSQQDMADSLGITRQALSHYETNRSEPNLTMLRAFADIYGVTTDYLVRGDESAARESVVDEIFTGMSDEDVALVKALIRRLKM